MGEIDVGALPVGSAHRLEGILTDRDGFTAWSRGLDPTTVRVREVASQPVIAAARTTRSRRRWT